MWQKFIAFCQGFHPPLQHLDAPSATVSAYLAQCFQNGLAGTTITSHSSAIAFKYQSLGFTDPTNNFLIRKLLKGARNLTVLADMRLPITLPILIKIDHAVQYIVPFWYNRLLIRAMFSFAFFAFCRVGEITLSPHTLMVQDVLFSPVPTVTVTFRHFKFSSPNKTFQIVISPQIDSVCPVSSLARYLKHRGPAPGPLFIFRDDTPVSRKYFIGILHEAIKFVNLSTTQYKSHSFRIGAATWAATKGYSDQQIRAMGRWSSSAFIKYIRISTL